MSEELHGDFETFSRCNLKTDGLDRYAKDSSTGIHCLGYAFGNEAPQVWTPRSPRRESERFLDHVAAGGLFYAHNAAFELALWNQVAVPRYGWPILKPEQVRCTMVMCYAMALPGALENAAPALGLVPRKDLAGHRVMLKLCKPHPKTDELYVYEDCPEDFEALYSYCAQDVVVERELAKRLLPLRPAEQKLWALDYKINQQGVLVDLPAIAKALKLVKLEKERLDKAMFAVTQGQVAHCTEVALLLQWIDLQGVEVPTTTSKTGEVKASLSKASVLDALEDQDLPDQVRVALELRQEAARSSTAKILSMQVHAADDGRVRGIHQFHGAGTGRWAGRMIQGQNLPRPRAGIKQKDIEDMFAHLDNYQYLDLLYGPVLSVLADCIRGLIIAPPGKDLIAVDFSAVEARVLAWLAGDEATLEVFRTHGKIYEHAASGIYRKPMEDVTKDERQIGKVSVLALGYGGGIGAFQSMAKNYFIKVPDAQADEIKKAWRLSHPEIVQFWYDLDDAAMAALTAGGQHSAGAPGRQVTFLKNGSFLWCKLPSGRLLCYPYPEVRTVVTPWGSDREAVTFMTVTDPSLGRKVLPDPNASGKWQRVSTYGGSWAENVTQAVARDLLAEALLRLDQHGATIDAHVHDEAVLEVPSTAGPETVKKIEALFAINPSWAEGLPLAAEGWRGPRFRK